MGNSGIIKVKEAKRPKWEKHKEVCQIEITKLAGWTWRVLAAAAAAAARPQVRTGLVKGQGRTQTDGQTYGWQVQIGEQVEEQMVSQAGCIKSRDPQGWSPWDRLEFSAYWHSERLKDRLAITIPVLDVHLLIGPGKGVLVFRWLALSGKFLHLVFMATLICSCVSALPGLLLNLQGDTISTLRNKSFIRLCCMDAGRQIVLFMCSVGCSVILSPPNGVKRCLWNGVSGDIVQCKALLCVEHRVCNHSLIHTLIFPTLLAYNLHLFIIFLCLEAGSHSVLQVGLELWNFLPQSPVYWDYRLYHHV